MATCGPDGSPADCPKDFSGASSMTSFDDCNVADICFKRLTRLSPFAARVGRLTGETKIRDYSFCTVVHVNQAPYNMAHISLETRYSFTSNFYLIGMKKGTMCQIFYHFSNDISPIGRFVSPFLLRNIFKKGNFEISSTRFETNLFDFSSLAS